MDRKVRDERVNHSPHAGQSPYRFPVRDLVRRPGARRENRDAFPLPEALGTDLIAVPEGATVQLDMSCEVVTDGIWVSGSFQGEAIGECGRCLDEVRRMVDVTFQGLFLYPDAPLGEDEDSDDVFVFDGETIDVEEVVRDAVVTSMPFTPLCAPDCQGLCDQCGARLADNPGHAHEVLDPRWAALQSVQDQSVKDRNERSDEKES